MERKISSGLKTIFIIHLVTGLIFGLVYLLIPKMFGQLLRWSLPDPMLYRLLGAAILGFSTSSCLALQNPYWENVKIIVLSEIVWTGLAAVITGTAMVMGVFPPAGWLNAFLMMFFAVAFTVFYFREKNTD